jgi:hypothetical protein
MSAIDALTKSIATTATGYAAVINGALDVTTIGTSRKNAAMKGLVALGVPICVVMLLDCDKEGCDCLVKTFEDRDAGRRIVPIKIEVTE